jgi:hypothetical protein
MPALVYPLVSWGTPDNLSTWTLASATATGGQADPFGGTGAYLLTDTSGAGFGYALSPDANLQSPAANNPVTVQFMVKAGTATASLIGIGTTSPSINIANLTLTWSGGVPTSTLTYDLVGTGQSLTPVALYNGWYLVGFTAFTNSTGNHNAFIYPDASGAAGTGTMVAYSRPVVLLEVDEPLIWAEPRAGHDTVQAPSGAEDAWWVGADYHFRAMARWIPSRAANTPTRISGWDGAAEAHWVNQGVQAMLLEGARKTGLTVAPSRASSASDYVTTGGHYLVEWPAPTLEPNGLRTFPFHIRNATGGYEGWLA